MMVDPIQQATAEERIRGMRTRVRLQHEFFEPRLALIANSLRERHEQLLGNLSSAGVLDDDSDSLVRARVKSEESAQHRLEERARDSVDHLPDYVGIRVIILDRDEIDQVISALGPVLGAHHVTEQTYYNGHGRSNGFAGWGVSGMPISELPSEIVDVVEPGSRVHADSGLGVEDLHWELQIQTVLQEAWQRVSHRRYYKSALGVPARSSVRLRRLAPILDLIDGEISAVRQEVKSLRERERQRLHAALAHQQLNTVAIDELAIQALAAVRPDLFENLRELGRRSGMQVSGWRELVRIGDETEICLEICSSTGMTVMSEFVHAVESFCSVDAGEAKNLQSFISSEGEESGKPFDRPLLVFSLTRLLSSNELPRIPAMAQPLWNRAAKWRESTR